MATETLTALAAALADGDVRVVDLTQPLSENTPVLQLPPPFANTPGLSRETISEFDDAGPAWAWSTLTVGEHVGTHFDAPIHWITGRDGEDVASVPPAKLVAPCAVIDKSAEAADDPNYLLTLADVQAWENQHGPLPPGGWLSCGPAGTRGLHDQDGVLERRRDARAGRGMCALDGRGLGIVASGRDGRDGRGHGALVRSGVPGAPLPAGAGKYGLTQLANLASLPPVGAVVVVAPLKLVRGTGSPTRCSRWSEPRNCGIKGRRAGGLNEKTALAGGLSELSAGRA